MSERLAIWPVRAEGERLAAALSGRLGAQLHKPWTDPRAQPEQFREQFRQYSHWVLVMASGIAVRLLGGLLEDKHRDPAVVVIDEAARHVIVLVGGHEAGANALAYRLANMLGAVPVLSTASEVLKPLVAGIGCRKGVSARQIEQALLRALNGRALGEVRELATIERKAQEPGLVEFCRDQAIALRVITSEQVAARPWVSQPSEWVRQSVGLAGVCEPCALIASPRGRLLASKVCCDGVAVALVEDDGWVMT